MKLVRTLLPIACAAALAGCVVAPYPRHGYYGPRAEVDIAVDVPPPEPYAEVVPAIPYVGAVWIGGYWGWNNGRYAWSRGYWSAPRPGYAWTPHRWENNGGRWYHRGGSWQRHG